MDNDDRPVGRLLSRREALAVLGTLSAAALAACTPGLAANPTPASTATASVASTTTAPVATVPVATAPAATVPATAPTAASTSAAAPAAAMCVVRPAMTEGPYFVDDKLNRSDIRSDPADGTIKDGVPLQITVNVNQLSGAACGTLAGATVDVWHCDASGVYSDVSDPHFNTQGKQFLRGYQATDANGQVVFTTIYPGWYSGRAVHIHFKIRTSSGHAFTSQWFFDDGLTDQVFTQAPYAARGARDTRNANDGIYEGGGDQTLLALTPSGAGYAAIFDIGLQFA